MDVSVELECAICYLSYNAGRRCPRELRCKHTFCESCLRALSRDPLTEGPQGDKTIICPLCRHSTSISAEEAIRAELRVDESAMEQLLLSGLLLEEEPEEPEEPEEGSEETEDDSEETEEHGTASESSAEDSALPEGDSRDRLRQTIKKVWRRLSRKNSRQTENNLADVSSEDLRSLAIMACYMF